MAESEYFEKVWKEKSSRVIEHDFRDSYTDDGGRKIDTYMVWVVRDPSEDEEDDA